MAKIDDVVAKEDPKALRKKIARLESDVDSMRKHVEQARSANRTKFVKPTRARKRIKDDWLRLILPDVHGSSCDQEVLATALAATGSLDIDEIVIGGDFLECGGFLAAHHTLGFVAQTEYSYENDIAAANQILDKLLSTFPSVKKFHYLEGNHELRVEKWAVTQAMRNVYDAQFLLDHIGPQNVLGLEDRGIKYYRQATKYSGLPIPGAIRLGKCHFIHGISTAKHAASQHALRLGGDVCYFHTHRGDTTETHTVGAGQYGAWNPGCLCVKQPMWQHTNPTMWTHGIGLQIVARSGMFQHINARIVDGVCLLAQMARCLSK